MHHASRRLGKLRMAFLLVGAATISIASHAGEPASKQNPQLARGASIWRV
jgi:hypothetical protein